MRRSALLAGGALLLTAGCGSGAAKVAASPTAAAVTPSPVALPTCPPATTAAYRWPKQVPQELPRLPGVHIDSSKQTAEGLFIVRFSTVTSLRDGVLFIVRRLPAAGFTLGRGDAEPTEADAPFTKGELRGVLRGAATGACTTQWVLAVTRQVQGGTGNPLLPPHTGPSPTPLPFG
jgi:hypothetical protein